MPERIGFLLVPGFSSLAFFCAVEPLRVANRLSGRTLYRWFLFTESGAPAIASNDMRMIADAPLRADAALDTLIICAGFDPLRVPEPEPGRGRGGACPLNGVLRRLAGRGVALGALDTGAFLLARAGLGSVLPMTLHWEAEPAFREAFPHIQVSTELFEDHGRLFTCAGGTASLDLMLGRIVRAHGAALARAISEQFIHERIRGPEDDQRMPVRRRLELGAGPGARQVARAVAFLEAADLEHPFDRARLAAHLGISARQVERLFRAHLQQTPASWFRMLRLQRGRALLRQTELAIVEIGAACGFGSRSDFSRCYRAVFGVAPGQDRLTHAASGANDRAVATAQGAGRFPARRRVTRAGNVAATG